MEENENTGEAPVTFIQSTGKKDIAVDVEPQPSECSLAPSNKQPIQFQKAVEDFLKREKKIVGE